jgi:hypothetical protein
MVIPHHCVYRKPDVPNVVASRQLGRQTTSCIGNWQWPTHTKSLIVPRPQSVPVALSIPTSLADDARPGRSSSLRPATSCHRRPTCRPDGRTAFGSSSPILLRFALHTPCLYNCYCPTGHNQDRLRAQGQKRDHLRAKPGIDHDAHHC